MGRSRVGPSRAGRGQDGGPGVESISVFDIFKIGVGPSSSHTMGPWRAAQQFLAILRDRGEFDRIASVRVDLFGSLAKTGKGHGTDVAVLMGLAGEDPVTCDPAQIHPKVAAIRSGGELAAGRRAGDPVRPRRRPRLPPRRDPAVPPQRPAVHGRRWTTARAIAETFYSVGGGFVVREGDPDGGRQARRPADADRVDRPT